MNCIDSLKLSMYADGEAPAGEAAEIERHLAECAACRSSVEAQRRVRSKVRGIPEKASSECPESGRIEPYLLGTDSADERRAIEAHAAECAPCRRMIFAPPAEPAPVPSQTVARVKARLRGLRRVNVIRWLAPIAAAAALLVAVGIGLFQPAAPAAITHRQGQSEDVRVSLSLRGAVADVKLDHAATETYEQKIVRLADGRPAESERRFRDSGLVVRIRRAESGKIEVARVSDSGPVEYLSSADNIAVDEACGLLPETLSGQTALHGDALGKLWNRMLPRGVSVEAVQVAARFDRPGHAELDGHVDVRAQNDKGPVSIRIPLKGHLKLSGERFDLELTGSYDAAQLRFEVRRDPR